MRAKLKGFPDYLCMYPLQPDQAGEIIKFSRSLCLVEFQNCKLNKIGKNKLRIWCSTEDLEYSENEIRDGR